MNLISFEGLTCYFSSIITIVNDMGIDFVPALGNLWSETMFKYDPFRNEVTSVRILNNLSQLGATLCIMPSNNPQEVEESISSLNDGEYLLVDMNAFHTPWSPSFGIFTGVHYFITRNTQEEWMICYDPVYSVENYRLPRKTVVAHAHEINWFQQGERKELAIDDIAELQVVVETLPDLHQQMLTWLDSFTAENHKDADKAARYVSCLINNRYMYRHYLQRMAPKLLDGNPLNSDEFYNDWKAVRNGLFKISIAREFSPVVQEVKAQIVKLIELELDTAKKLCVR